MYFQCLRDVFDQRVIVRSAEKIYKINSEFGKFKLRRMFVKSDSDHSELGQMLIQLFWKSSLPKMYEQNTGHEPMLILQICTLRHQKTVQDINYVPWHLDANFYGFEPPLWTIWVPFTRAGADAPGLEFALPSGGAVFDAQHAINYWRSRPFGSDGSRVIQNDDLLEFYGGAEFDVVTKFVKPGDAFVFDQFVLHRTQMLLGATKERLAIEYRVSSATVFPPELEFDYFRHFLVSVRQANGTIVMRNMQRHFDSVAKFR